MRGNRGGWTLTHADVVLAAITPDVIWHLKPTQTENSLSAPVHWALPPSPYPELQPQLHCKERTHREDTERGQGQISCFLVSESLRVSGMTVTLPVHT